MSHNDKSEADSSNHARSGLHKIPSGLESSGMDLDELVGGDTFDE
jgi:hypothetical protein